jgi:hypothetical protein
MENTEQINTISARRENLTAIFRALKKIFFYFNT